MFQLPSGMANIISEGRKSQHEKLANARRPHRFYTCLRVKSKSTYQHVYVRDAARAVGLQYDLQQFSSQPRYIPMRRSAETHLASAMWTQTMLVNSPSEEARQCKSARSAAVEMRIVKKHKMCRIRSDTTFRIYLSAHKLL